MSAVKPGTGATEALLSMLMMNERYFVLSQTNGILEKDTLWDMPPELDPDLHLGVADLQHYTQLRSFVVVKKLAYHACDTSPLDGATRATTLTIPYTFKLKQVIPMTEGSNIAVLYYIQDASSVCHETPYLNLVRSILTHGEPRDDRTGTGTLSVFAHQIRFDIRESVPLLTTKFVPWKSCLQELLWFLKGRTDSRELEAVGVGIWKGNTRRAFLDQRGLTDLPEGDIGAGYGFQWRHFGAPYVNCETDATGSGYDQITEVIRQLKHDPMSRRILFSAWNPAALDRMALPPCHVLCQFYVSMKTGSPVLSCHMYQRSQDVFLGAPFNIFSYTALTYLLAKMCGMTPGELVISTGDTHIYKDHIEAMREQMRRMPLAAPVLTVADAVAEKSIDDITVADFQLHGYFYHPKLYGKMSV